MPQQYPFQWYVNVRRFRERNGRFIAGEKVSRYIEDTAHNFSVTVFERTMRLVDDYSTDKLIAWATEMRNDIRNMHTAFTMIALGGKEASLRYQAENADIWNYAEQLIARQLRYFDNFVLQVLQGRVAINPAMAVRAAMYGEAGNTTYQNLLRWRESFAGQAEERRVLGEAQHCDDCIIESAKGWQPIGTLRDIGDSQCIARCKCHFEFRTRSRFANGNTSGEKEEQRPTESLALYNRDLSQVPKLDKMQAIDAKWQPTIDELRRKDNDNYNQWLKDNFITQQEAVLGKTVGGVDIEIPKEFVKANRALQKALDKRSAEMLRLFWLKPADRINLDDVVVVSSRFHNQFVKKVIKPGVQAWTKLVSNKLGYAQKIIVDPMDEYEIITSGRAGFSPGEVVNRQTGMIVKNAGMLKLSPFDDWRTTSHELTHALEHFDSKVLEQTIRFYNYRTRNDHGWRLFANDIDPHFAPDEQYKRDYFVEPYSGKRPYLEIKYIDPKTGEPKYGDRIVATEILSTGYEQLLRDPLRFAKSDPEYFNFILTVLRGDEWQTPR